jgi:hypothetical protein
MPQCAKIGRLARQRRISHPIVSRKTIRIEESQAGQIGRGSKRIGEGRFAGAIDAVLCISRHQAKIVRIRPYYQILRRLSEMRREASV